MPKLLGYLGLLPFIVPTVFLFFDDSHLDMWRHFLLSYGAVILSFVGALHWSFAMLLHELPINKQRWSFFWSVVPSLVAWVSLSIPKFYGFILLTVFFAIALIRDKQLSDKAELPAWYTPLRRNLTIVAMTCLLVAAYLGNGRQLMNLIWYWSCNKLLFFVSENNARYWRKCLLNNKKLSLEYAWLCTSVKVLL